MSVTYDALLGDTQLIQYKLNATNTDIYPDSNTVAITGPIWLPRIYGKDLTAFEIASSGRIAISLNDIHTLDINRSNYVNSNNFKNTIVSQSNYSLEMIANAGNLAVVLDAYSNNINVTAASNVSVTAQNGTMSLTSSNAMNVSTCNNLVVQAQSNITFNAVTGSASLAANNSNISIVLDRNTNNMNVYASNDLAISACNNSTMFANSNVTVGATNGTLKACADGSNMVITLDRTTDSINMFAVSNMSFVASNNTSMIGKSNVTIGAMVGSASIVADSSNLYLTLDRATDNATLYAASNIVLVASNSTTINSKSNVIVNAINGDFQAFANNSNMYLTMSQLNNNITLYSSNNLAVSVCNNYTTAVRNNLTQSTVAGDYLLYVNNSNMFLRMSSVTNNTFLQTSNTMYLGASNGLVVNTQSNVSMTTTAGSVSIAANSSNMTATFDATTNNVNVFASNNMALTASNTLNVNTNSNIYMGALAGDFRAYAHGSNMYVTMNHSTDQFTAYTSSNMSLSASNNFDVTAKSNVTVSAVNGSTTVSANGSRMSLSMSQATNNVTLYASNNIVQGASNDFNIFVQSNLTASTTGGDVKIYANNSNMFFVMDASTNNTTLSTFNNMTTSVGNVANVTATSNYNLNSTLGDINLSAKASNMFLTMTAATNTTTMFASNNLVLSASNSLTETANSNVTMTAQSGSFNVYANNSRMSISMDSTNNNMSVYASNNYAISSCNTINENARSNIYVGALGGDYKVYAKGSNMFMTMDSSTNNVSIFASNNMALGASNTMNINAKSNIYVGALNGDLKMYSTASNMYMTMCNATNNIDVFASNNLNIAVSNSTSMIANNNMSFSGNNGSVSVYAATSNVSLVMDRPTTSMSLYALSNMTVTACNTYTTTGCNVRLYASTCNMFLTMDASTRNVTMFASNNFDVGASNNLTGSAQGSVTLTASTGDFSTTADAAKMYLTMTKATDALTLYTVSNMAITASNTLNVNAKSNIYMGALAGDFAAYANGSNMFVTMQASTNNLNMFGSNNVSIGGSNGLNLSAQSNVDVNATAGDLKMYANSSNMYVTMTQATNNQTMYALNNIAIISSNTLNMSAQSNATLLANVGSVTVQASNNVTTIASNNINSIARCNVTLAATNGSFAASANNSNMYLSMNQATNNVTLYGLNNMALTASNNYTLNAQNNIAENALAGSLTAYAFSNYMMAADNSNMSIKMSAVGDVISLYSLSNISISASNNMWLDSLSNMSLTSSNINITARRDINISACNNITISACNTVSLNFQTFNTNTTNDQSFTARSNVFFYINSSSNPSSPIFTVQNDQVLIRGDIIVTGNINTSNVFSTTVIQESLKIADKQLTVASMGSNFNPADGPFDGGSTNSGAGLVIDGVPTGFDSNIPQAYDKSLLWNYGNSGITAMGTASGMSNESYWEMKGGNFRMTHQKIIASGGSNIVRDVSFTLRVNQNDELELVKKFWSTSSNAYVFRPVARFGRVL